MLILLGQSIVTAVLTATITTVVVLRVTNACQSMRDIRNIMFWEKELRQIESFKEFIPKGR